MGFGVEVEIVALGKNVSLVTLKTGCDEHYLELYHEMDSVDDFLTALVIFHVLLDDVVEMVNFQKMNFVGLIDTADPVELVMLCPWKQLNLNLMNLQKNSSVVISSLFLQATFLRLDSGDAWVIAVVMESADA